MTTLAAPRAVTAARRPRPPSWRRRLGPAWPLKVLLLGFPLWWVLGLASFAILIFSVPMGVQVWRRRRDLALPVGFGLWLVFLLWMLAGVFVLWADAPGTLPEAGPQQLVGFGYRVLWYLAITIGMLYPLSLPRSVPSIDVARWMSYLFLVCVVGGVAALVAPSFSFTSPAELLIPGARTNGFIRALTHPSLSTSSDFLGYEQPRPKAPFVYPNAWGNNVGLLVPFFFYVWHTSRRRWQRIAAPVVLAVLAVPVAYSLNRGLWLGLCLVTVYTAVALARRGRMGALWALVVSLVVAMLLLVASPLWSTITLRLDTPHSNDRRATVAEVVTTTTWEGSPLLGYGTTRKVQGNFESIAGGGTPRCRQCAAPPLGTQGFLWRLIFTTGFVGTALFLSFIAVQWLTHARRRDPFSVLGCMTLATSALFFMVYDSLESPLFTLMLAVGLMNRERLAEPRAEADADAAERERGVLDALWPEGARRIIRRPTRQPSLLILPAKRRPRVLVPSDVPAASAMLRRHVRRPLQRLVQDALAAAQRARVLQLLPVARIVPTEWGHRTETIDDYVAAHVPGAARTGLLLGPPRPNAKPILQVFDADGRTVAFGKVGQGPLARDLVRAEVAALQELDNHPLTAVELPRVISAGTWRDLEIVMLTPLSGAQQRSSSWDPPLEAMYEVAESAAVRWSSVDESPYVEGLANRVRAVPDREAAVALDATVALTLRDVGSVVLGFGRWHGDWAPWNMARVSEQSNMARVSEQSNMARVDGRVQLWDWERSRTGVPLGFDVVHFLVQRELKSGSVDADSLDRVIAASTSALERWYHTLAAVELTVLLYLVEIAQRYYADAGPTPPEALGHRLEAVNRLIAAATARQQESLGVND